MTWRNKRDHFNNYTCKWRRSKLGKTNPNHHYFVRLLKKETNDFKSDIIRHLWKIIISDKSVDQYESNLMRRICGLIYFSDKMSAEIKLQVLKDK